MASNIDQFTQATPFIGRAREIDDLQRQIEKRECRLISLVGVGGVGKTRLAVRVAAGIKDRYRDGVWFVDLQPVQSAEQMVMAIADVLNVSLSGQRQPHEAIIEYLQQKNMLLIMDNFEHLLEGTPFLAQIVHNVPGVQILVTSREALNLPEEWLYPIKGLPVPPSHQTTDIATYPSIQLFVRRAQQVRPAFSLKDERAGVIRICQLLEGLPLAIEMAAVWTKTLRCSEITAEIQRNLNFLESKMRDVPKRHRSMQAVFAQTWARMTIEEQTGFKKLSVFRGGFEREAAERVASTSLAVLTDLLDRCLISRDQSGRFHVHALLRQYAEGKLTLEEADQVGRAHCQYFAEFLSERNRDINEGEQLETTFEIERELENIRAAWQYALDSQQTDALRQAAATYFYFCQIQSHFLESANALQQAAQVVEAEGERELLAQLLVYWGWMLIRLGRFEQAESVLQRSLSLFEATGQQPAYGMGSHPLAPVVILKVTRGMYSQAIQLGKQLKQESETRNDIHNLSFACYGLTSAYLRLGQYDLARQNAQQAVRSCEATGNKWFMAYCLVEWGNVAKATENYTEAETHYTSGLRIREAFNDPEGIAVLSARLAEIALLKYDYDTAQHLYERSLAMYRDLNDKGGLATVYRGLGQVSLRLGDIQQAIAHFRTALSVAAEIRFHPLILSIMLDVAGVMLNTRYHERALELLQTVIEHPASSAQHHRELERYLPQLELPDGQMSPPELDTVVAVLQAELEDIGLSIPTPGDQPLIDPLTPRELEILELLAEGLTNPAIAEQLVISVGTVKSHTSRIYSKLGVSNRTEAAVKARQLSLLED